MLSAATSAPTPSRQAPSMPAALRPLAVDIAVPLAIYYLLHAGLGVGLVASLSVASIVPVARTIDGYVRNREINALALLILGVNIAGILLTLVSGNARVIYVKNSGISSVIALGIIVSVVRGRPLMTAGLKPFITKGDQLRTAAWERLASGEQFRRYENHFSLIWGFSLLTECALRVVGAFTLSLSTMAWLSDVLLVIAIAFAMIVAGGTAASKLEELVDAEVRA